MRLFFKALKTDLKRQIISINFLLMVILASLCYFMSILDELRYLWNSTSADVLYFFDIAQNIGYFTSMSILCCTTVNCTSFLRDYHSGYYRHNIMRSGKFNYILSKYISCVITGGLILAVGLALFLFVLAIRFPLISDDSYYLELYIRSVETIFPAELLKNGKYVGFFTIYIFLAFIYGALWSGMGIAVSSFITDKYVASFSPYILWFGSSCVLTGKLRTEIVFKGNYSVGGLYGSLLYAILYFGSIVIVLAIMFCKNAERRCDG